MNDDLHLIEKLGNEFFRRQREGVAPSPDGKYFLSAGKQSVRLWDATTYQNEIIVTNPEPLVSRVAWSADGKEFGIAGEYGQVTFWDGASKTQVGKYERAKGDFRGMSYSPDGKFIALCDDQVIALLDAKSKQLVRELKGHTRNVHDAVFSRDSSTLYSGGKDGKLNVWDVQTGKLRKTLAEIVGTINTVDVDSRELELLIATPDSGCMLVRVTDGRQRTVLATRDTQFSSARFSTNGSYLLVAANDGTLRLWDATNLDELCHYDFSSNVFDAIFTQNDSKIIVALHDGLAILDANDRNGNDSAVTPLVGSRENWHSANAKAARDLRDWYGCVAHLADLQTLDPDSMAIEVSLRKALNYLRQDSPELLEWLPETATQLQTVALVTNDQSLSISDQLAEEISRTYQADLIAPEETLTLTGYDIELVNSVVEKFPIDRHLRTLAIVLYRSDQIQEAKERFEALSDKTAVDLAFLAMCYQRLGNKRTSKRAYKAFRDNPDSDSRQRAFRKLVRELKDLLDE